MVFKIYIHCTVYNHLILHPLFCILYLFYIIIKKKKKLFCQTIHPSQLTYNTKTMIKWVGRGKKIFLNRKDFHWNEIKRWNLKLTYYVFVWKYNPIYYIYLFPGWIWGVCVHILSESCGWIYWTGMDKIIIKRHNINYNVYIMVLIGKGGWEEIYYFWLCLDFLWFLLLLFWEENFNILWFSRFSGFRFNHLINNLIKNRYKITNGINF